MIRLFRILREFGDALEASLAVDLRDFYRAGAGSSKLTARRLNVLINGLPDDATLWRVVDEHNRKTAHRAMVGRLRAGRDRFNRRKREAEQNER